MRLDEYALDDLHQAALAEFEVDEEAAAVLNPLYARALNDHIAVIKQLREKGDIRKWGGANRLLGAELSCTICVNDGQRGRFVVHEIKGKCSECGIVSSVSDQALTGGEQRR
jgi:hypothetical protein